MLTSLSYSSLYPFVIGCPNPCFAAAAFRARFACASAICSHVFVVPRSALTIVFVLSVVAMVFRPLLLSAVLLICNSRMVRL